MRKLWISLTSFSRRIAASLRFGTEEREMREEMQFHIDMAAAKHRATGMTERDARRAARLSFGGVEQWREAGRDEARSRLSEDLLRDLRYAVRSLRRAPTFTVTVLASLAIGIGAVSTVWTVTERVILRALPYGAGGPLVFIWTNYQAKPTQGDVDSYPDFLDWTKNNPDLQHAAVFNIWTPTLTEGTDPEPLLGSRVSAGFFDVLGVRPILGRTFRADEDVPNGPPVAVIAHSLWTRRFHSDSSIVGKTIGVNGYKYTVVGVMPASFRDPEPFWSFGAEIWRPFGLTATSGARGGRWLRVIARIKPGVSIERAQRDLDAVAARLSRDYPESNKQRGALIRPMQEQVVGATRPIVLAALGGALCLLLIVCGNVASLLLSRQAVRAPELAIRGAMGAERSRVARLLALETLVLAAVGCVTGLVLATVACAVLRHAAPPGLPRADEIHVDLVAVLVTTLCAGVAALLFGVIPSWTASRMDLASVFQSMGRTTARGRARSAIVVAELAFSLVLLVAAGLLAKSIARMNDVPVGLDPRGVVAFEINLPGSRYKTDSSYRIFFERFRDDVARSPGVAAVAMTSAPPFTGLNDMTNGVHGPVEHPFTQDVTAHMRSISPGYFAVLRIPITGREFTDQDRTNTPRVAIINRLAADAWFPGENAVGRRLLLTPKDSVPVTIVGVAGNVRFYGPTSTPEPELFLALPQNTWSDYTVLVSGSGPGGALLARARSVLHGLDPNVPLSDPATLSDEVEHFTSRQRYYATVFGVFAAIALLVSAVGIFGVIAYAATQRQREIAIRLALGARAEHIAARFVGSAAALVVLGIVLGLGASVAIGRALTSLLFDVKPADASTLAGAAVLLSVVGIVAACGPAVRAMRAPPVNALRL